MHMNHLAVVLLCVCSARQGNAQLTEPISSELTIVTLGDSITKGVRSGVTSKQTFAAVIEGQLKKNGRSVQVKNVGIGGERSDQALRRLDKVIRLKPDIVTIMYGTNDSYVDRGKSANRITVDGYTSNLNQIVIELLRRGIVPVLMTEPRWSEQAAPNGLGENPNERLEPYVRACRQTAAAWRVPLVDHFAAWTAARSKGFKLHDWTTDGCHPNPTGHAQLAQSMLPVLQQVIGPKLKTRRKLLAKKHVRVVCFGDSVTGVYYHTGSRQAYTDMVGVGLRQLSTGGSIEAINAGISGHTTVNALSRIDKDVLAHKPDLVTVMFGLNDMTRVSLEDYTANLRTIVSKCRGIGADVVLATPNNVVTTSSRPTEKLVKYCDAVRAVARELQVPLCDVYREMSAIRAHDEFDWRLIMSDAIHPNMDGHKRIAEQLVGTIAGRRISLAGIKPPPALASTLKLLRAGKTVRVLAMPPMDSMVERALLRIVPGAKVEVVTWPTAGLTIRALEQDAKARVRVMKPNLVVLAVPRSSAAINATEFANSYTWIMNWSLNFGPPTWDCVVVHPSVVKPNDANSNDELITRLVAAQHLHLISRPSKNSNSAESILSEWLRMQSEAIK